MVSSSEPVSLKILRQCEAADWRSSHVLLDLIIGQVNNIHKLNLHKIDYNTKISVAIGMGGLDMPKSALVFLFAFLAAGSVFAQNNTTAGLAGIGAGAALSAASGQNGTTPSSAGGGGSAPIEIQIMVFKGLQDIAKNVAELTAKHVTGCYEGLGNKDTSEDSLERDRLNVRMNCAILIEDPASANQIALYQAVHAYYAHLKLLDAKLQPYFLLQVPQSITFSQIAGQSTPMELKLTNTSRDKTQINIEVSVKGKYVEDASKTETPADELLIPDSSDCARQIQPNDSCTIKLLFPNPKKPTPLPGKLTAEVAVSNKDTGSIQRIQLTGEVKPAVETDFKSPLEFQKYLFELRKPLTLEQNPGLSTEAEKLAPPSAQASTSAAGGGGSTGSSSASSTPVGLTYLSDIGTALGGLKSNITYGPSSSQPTLQAFEGLVEDELRIQGIFPYSSTSALDLQAATYALSGQFGEMLVWGNDVSTWTNQCKPPSENGTQNGKSQNGSPLKGNGPPNANPPSGPQSNSACTTPEVVSDLAVAQQMITGYAALLATANDGSGNPVIVSVLRGRVLSDKLAEGMPSLQLAVAAAGGSTKTNSFFLVNLFYTFAPSYNGGVIATFELRDNHNDLWESGARNVLFDYRKWKSRRFDTSLMKNADTCGSFCSVETP
jgi:hypothetical protein